MKVILTDKVKSLGNIGDIVNVSEGYGRNFLIPKKIAKLADEGNAKQMADYQKMLAKKVAEEKAAAEKLAASVSGKTITLIKKVGGNGSLFGSVTTTDISKELEKQDISIEKRMISMAAPIKNLGDFEVKAKVFTGVEATFNVRVEIDPKQAEELKKIQAAKAKKAAEKKAAPAEGEAEVDAETTVAETTEESTEA